MSRLLQRGRMSPSNVHSFGGTIQCSPPPYTSLLLLTYTFLLLPVFLTRRHEGEAASDAKGNKVELMDD